MFKAVSESGVSDVYAALASGLISHRSARRAIQSSMPAALASAVDPSRSGFTGILLHELPPAQWSIRAALAPVGTDEPMQSFDSHSGSDIETHFPTTAAYVGALSSSYGQGWGELLMPQIDLGGGPDDVGAAK